MNMDWIANPIPSINLELLNQAREHQNQLTKPAGSLGKLEEAACQLAAMQNSLNPQLDRIHITIFAADHGIVEEGVSAFPQAVTVEMIKNFSKGGAAISVLAKQHNAHLEVVNTGTVTDPGALQHVINTPVAAGTNNFANQAAMDDIQLNQALNLGREAIHRALDRHAHCFIGGEMGIGNTTSATAIIATLAGHEVDAIVGSGTGLDSQGVALKSAVIKRALALHKEQLLDPRAVLRCLGGFEISALTGAYIAAAQARIPIIIDGFITTAAALCAINIAPNTREWMLFSHRSAEPGHRMALAHLDADPLLELDMRLGEGSGAAVALSLFKSACQLHNEMATFADAGVSEKT